MSPRRPAGLARLRLPAGVGLPRRLPLPRKLLLPRRWALPPLFSTLPGAARRRRLLLVGALALLVWLLRPWPPFQLLPGWCVGGLLLWALAELLAWLWAPQRSA